MDDLEEPVSFNGGPNNWTVRRMEGPRALRRSSERSDLDPTLPENEHMQDAIRDAI